MKNFIYLILFFTLNNSSNLEKDNDKIYLSSLLYLKTNEEVNSKIKAFAKKWLKKEKIPKDKIIEFNLSNDISFLTIFDFKDKIDYSVSKIDEDLVENIGLYNKEYFFEPFEYPLFKKIIPRNSSKLFLIFSKPTDNYLLAEFLIKDVNNDNQFLKTKQGPSLQLLFVFDEENTIIQFYTSGTYYN